MALASVFMLGSYQQGTAQAPHYYGFRGPQRDGIYREETGLLKEWPSEGPEVLWKSMDAGKGYSSPVIVGNRLYLTGMNEEENKEIFQAYTLDGQKIYQVEYGSPWTQSYPDTRSTPTIVGDKAYVSSGMGEVVCLNIADGKEVWKVDGQTLGRKTGTWGTSECLLVFDNKVIFCPGGDQMAMVALDAQTGEIVWKSKSLGDISNYASPILVTYKGKKQIVTLTGLLAIGVDPDNGDIKWTFDDWGQESVNNGWEKISPNLALYQDGHILFSEGYNTGAFMLALNDNLDDVSLAWKNADLDTHIGAYVLLDGIIYGSNWINNGTGKWMAVDWNNGETKYESDWPGGKGKGSIISADGMLYCYDERRGTVGLVKPNPAQFEVVSEFRITDGSGAQWAHPVIDKGILYMRHGSALMAYKIK